MGNSCISEVSIHDYVQRLRFNKAKERVPLAGTFELTFRCNNRCVHCYSNKNARDRREKEKELTHSQVCRILDTVAEAGCLFLLFTGGEPLIREDFPEIYAYAKGKGFLPTLFTNGTLIDREMADFLREWPPRSIEITLYGMSQGVYEKVTRVPGSHAKCMRGIELLVERNLPLKLKAMILTLNRHELDDMKAFARDLGLEFRYDPLLNLRIDGGANPGRFRLPPAEVIQMDLDDKGRRSELMELYERFTKPDRKSEAIFTCGAGTNSFHINPHGLMQICGMVRNPGYDLINGSFREGWNIFFPAVRARRRKGDDPCRHCNLHVLCGQCPGWSQLEHGDMEKPVEYLCQVGRLRGEQLAIEDGYEKPVQTEVKG